MRWVGGAYRIAFFLLRAHVRWVANFIDDREMKHSIAAILPVLLLTFSAPAANPKYRLVQFVQELDADGTSLPLSAIIYTYDCGRLIRAESELDRNRDGIMDLQNTVSWTYNADGQRVIATSQSRTIPEATLTIRR